MPIRLVAPNEERRRREISRAAEVDQAETIWRRRVVRAWLIWGAWYGVGTAIAWSSFAVQTQELGAILLHGGLAVGNIGAWFSIYLFYDAAERRGDV